MIALRVQCGRILIDIDTQRDHFYANGAASVYNHRRLLATIRRVMAAARHDHIPTISTAQIYDNHRRNPGFCLEGTNGLKKLRYTVRDNYTYYHTSNSTDLPRDLLSRYNQVIFYKRCEDPFEEPRLDRLLTELQANEVFLIGATAEGSVKATALGLIKRGKKVNIFVDAVGTRDRYAAGRAFREMASKGAVLCKATKLLGISTLRTVHACPCRYCKKMIVGKRRSRDCLIA